MAENIDEKEGSAKEIVLNPGSVTSYVWNWFGFYRLRDKDVQIKCSYEKLEAPHSFLFDSL